MILAALVHLLAVAGAGEGAAAASYETVEVAPRVLAFIGAVPRGSFVNGNVAAILGDEAVMVVDTGQVPSLARRMIADIRARTDKPVRFVVITHWHWDHNLAASVYREAFPGAAIVSTGFTRKSLLDFTPGFLQFFRGPAEKVLADMRAKRASASGDAGAALEDQIADLEAGIPEIRGATLVAPDLTVDDALTVHLGGRDVRVFHPGRANTAGDLLVHVPDARVLVTGDLIVAPTPYATSAYFVDWIAALKTIAGMDLAAIVPGHGPVLRDKAYVGRLTALLESLVAQVGRAVARGLSLDETRKVIDLEAFRAELAGTDRRRRRAFEQYFLAPAITTAWKQARGEPTTESPF